MVDTRRWPRTSEPSESPANPTRSAILQTARVRFAERGFENTSVGDLCEGAFISRGAFYHHFASKEAVLVALTFADGPRVQEPFEKVLESDAPSLAVLSAALGIFTHEVASAPREINRTVVGELVRSWASDAALQSPLADNLRRVMVRAGQRSELPTPWEARELAAVIFAVVLGAVLEWLADESLAPDDLFTLVWRRVVPVMRASDATP